MPKRTPGGRQVRFREAARRCLLPLLAAALTVFIASGGAAGAAAPGTAQPSTSSPDLLGSLALQQAEWLDPGATGDDFFGYSVALSGDTALVGAYQRSVNGKQYSGAVYVFVRSGSGWSQQAVLTPADAAAGDFFGWSVALSGDVALIGADQKTITGAGLYAGAAYVFTRSGSTWSQQAELTASGEAAFDLFGSAVALSGGTALIGADQRPVNGQASAGAVYVFTGSGATWSQQAELTASDAATNDTFGCAVALSGDTAVAGAYDKAVGAAANAGAAYVFTGSGATWSQQTELTDPDPKTNDSFGSAVALSGDTALVGAVEKRIVGRSYVGAAYAYTRLGAAWSQPLDLVASGAGASDGFGASVAISGDVALVGAYGAGLSTQAGSASVFVRSDNSWSQYDLLAASDAAAGGTFGLSLALSGGTAVVGAPSKSGGGAPADSAYAYLLDGTAPVTTATGLQALSTAAWQKIPAQVSLSAADTTGGVGLAATYYTIDGGAQQTYAAPFTLADGAHTVTYWSVDKVGNVETAHSGYANIDTKAPTVTAKKMMLKAAKAKKGKTLKFKLTVADPTPSCGGATVTVTLTTKKGKKLWSLVRAGQPTNKALAISYKLHKTLKKGTYSIVCTSTDAAGNVQAKATKAKLKIT